MVVFCKYIYTQLLLYKSSWGSLLYCLSGLAGVGDHVSCCQTTEWWKRTQEYLLFVFLPQAFILT